MEYQKAEIQGGQLKIVESRTINQLNLTSECWTVQFQGLTACKTCEYGRTRKTIKGIVYSRDCGGRDIRKTGLNGKGLKVPV